MAIAETIGEIQVYKSPKGATANRPDARESSQLRQQISVAVPGTFSEQAFVISMPDDSMFPEIRHGEYLAFDPTVSPDAGDVVLIQDECNGLWIRKYRPLLKGCFDAPAINEDHGPLHSQRDGLRVLAVMVAHFRGRRVFDATR